MVRKVYGGKALTTDEEIVDKILKLPITDQKRLTDILRTLQSYGSDNKNIAEKLIETMKTGKFYKDDYDLLVQTGIIILMEKTYKEKIEEIEKKKECPLMKKHNKNLKYKKRD